VQIDVYSRQQSSRRRLPPPRPTPSVRGNGTATPDEGGDSSRGIEAQHGRGGRSSGAGLGGHEREGRIVWRRRRSAAALNGQKQEEEDRRWRRAGWTRG
jgi:hypothetical protein